jgi:hypothetical protein
MTSMADHYAWPVPSPADTAHALEGIDGDIRHGLPPKIGDVLVFLAAIHAADEDQQTP